MNTVSTVDPALDKAIERCKSTLQEIADYVLEPALSRRLLELSERKEFLEPHEIEELKALIDFSERRTLEKLKAMLALQGLKSAHDQGATPR